MQPGELKQDMVFSEQLATDAVNTVQPHEQPGFLVPCLEEKLAGCKMHILIACRRLINARLAGKI